MGHSREHKIIWVFFGFLFFLSKYLNSKQKKPQKHRAEQGIAMAGGKKKRKKKGGCGIFMPSIVTTKRGFWGFLNEIDSKKLLSYIFSM